MKREIKTKDAPQAIGPYSQAIVAGATLYVSGQLGLHPVSGELAADIAEQARQALTNLRSVLAAAGSSLGQVVKTTVFLTDLGAFDQVNRVYGEFFTPPYPARSCVQVSRLPKGGAVEIEAVALVGGQG